MSMTNESSADSCIQFADHLGLLAAAKGSNIVFSPLSIRAALSLAAVGSKGQTLDQFLSFLGSSTISELNSTAARLLGSVRSSRVGDSNGSRLSFVNGIWVDQSTPLKDSFQEIAGSVYEAVAESVDFQNKAPQVAMEVNAWVENASNGLVKDLLPNGSVNDLTRVILANALYFRGIWAEKFDKSKTLENKFHLFDGSTVQVPFMTSKEKQYISSYESFQVLKLPYLKDQENRSFSLLIFLPNQKNGLHNLIKMAISDTNFFDRHGPRGKYDVGNFMIPKFKISSGFEASEFLKSLGLEIPFSEQANFTEMLVDPSSKLHVSSVHHKATIDVDEEGTTAAAATGVVAMLLCYIPPVDFVADHPFMFAIREEETGSLLFLGHVANPLMVETST